MKDNKQLHNKDYEELPPLWDKLTTPAGKDKTVVWAALSAQIEQETTTYSIKSHWWKKIVVAASILIVAGIATMRFYTNTVYGIAGQQVSHILPDGSVIQLNAASSITYAPYWWFIDRNVHLEGEAFFEVKKGSKFEVVSTLATTTVLGTSFNIFARDHQYEVYCKTGKVRVTTPQKEMILLPNQQVKLIHEDLIKFTNPTMPIAWVNNKFNFQETALELVIQEIERYYTIRVDLNIKEEKIVYTGFFERNKEEEQTLQIIAASLGLSVEKIANKHYVLNQ